MGGEFDPEKALIEHYDGSAWTAVIPPGKGPRTLRGVAVIATNDVWAVGTRLRKRSRRRSVDKTLALHWDGKSWTTVQTPNVGEFGSSLAAVDATTPGDVWAVGHYLTEKGKSKALTLHYDGSAWRYVLSPNPKHTSRSLDGVAAVSFGTDAWAVGSTARGNGEPRPLVQRWDGSDWTKVDTPEPAGTSSLSDVDNNVFDRSIFAVGTEDLDAASSGFSLHLDDEGWTLAPIAPTGGTFETLAGVDARDQVFAVGSYLDATGWHALVQTYSSNSDSWSQSPAQDQGMAGTYLKDVSTFSLSGFAVGSYANPDAGSFTPGSHTLIEKLTC